MPIKAVIFDYLGTLVNCRGYSMEDSENKLHSSLVDEGFKVSKDAFLAAYREAHQKYRKIRYHEYREVTNAIWVSEALSNLGFDVSAQDARVKAALNVFFQDFIDTFVLRAGAKRLLSQTQTRFKVGLISNFTYAPVIHKSLRELGISEYFNAVVVSEEFGWRKPHGAIFLNALGHLQVGADETVYVGDSPLEDIKGARDAGLQTIFITSQFNKLKDLTDSKQTPDYIAKSLSTVGQQIDQMF